ncbi:MAG: GTPase [Nanopusillaceae archaeon]
MDKRLLDLINRSDVLLEILDSRFPKECRIRYLEEYIKSRKKKLIIVLNKADLVTEDFLSVVVEEFNKEFPTVYVSAKTRKGSRKLRKTIKENSDKNKEKVYIGLFGYPNTGKSSVINLLVGRKRAKTSPIPGFTRGLQIVKLSRRFYLIDSPGVVIPEDKYLLAILGGIKVENLEFPQKAVLYLYKKIGKTPFKEYYKIEFENIKDLFLKLREKYNIKDKDWIKKVARIILYDWQKGNLKGFWF